MLPLRKITFDEPDLIATEAKEKCILVTGAGGFIGHHLVKRLKRQGHFVVGVDLKYPEFEKTKADRFIIGDLRQPGICLNVTHQMDEVYHLAADMGGIGYITTSYADIARNNCLMTLHMLEASILLNVKKFLFSSTACVYPSHLQQHTDMVVGLKEGDAIPADPEAGYGWEKLFAEQMCKYYQQDHGLAVRIVRFHNVYGPLGVFDGGKEKAPAAICRKIAQVNDGGQIEVWGDGLQTRSFMFIDDCVEGLIRLMKSDFNQPLNLGRDEMVSVNQLVDAVAKVAGKQIQKCHNLSKPQGVRGRNSDNNLCRQVLSWEPRIGLDEGLRKTYPWIAEMVNLPSEVSLPLTTCQDTSV